MIMTYSKIKYLVLLISLVALIISCNKDDTLNDFDLFARLSRDGGNWKVVKFEYYDNSIQNATVTTREPNDEFMRFFERSYRALDRRSLLINLSYVAIYKGDTYAQVAFGAEKERVTFDYTSLYGRSWTVEENKKNRQVWNYVKGDSTTRMTLERCSVSEFPDVPIETGG